MSRSSPVLETNSPLDAVDGVINDFLQISADNAGPKNFLENLEAFSYAIDWSELWLSILIAFHLCLLLLVVLGRQIFEIQMMVLLICTILVLCAEYINKFGQEFWREFATQDYFDSQGVFISCVLSAPLILISFFILLNGVYQAGSLLIKVKRHDILNKQKQNSKHKKKNKELTNKKGNKGD